MSKNAENYERITNALIALIERDGTLPWQKPWKSQDTARSMATGKTYNGINRWMLTATADAFGWSPWFGTYRQIEALGGQVRKGEKSSLAILWKPMEKTDANGNVDKFFMMRVFNVFSASQADGLPEKFYTKPDTTTVEILDGPQEILEGFAEREDLEVIYGGSRACYTPRTDKINLPQIATFLSSEHFYATAFHEAAHATGSAKRLNRPGIVDFDAFGSHQYSREELVAEFTSAMVMGTLGLDKPNMVENQAAYLKSWVSRLQDDPQALIWAAGRAEKAANLILGFEKEVEVAE